MKTTRSNFVYAVVAGAVAAISIITVLAQSQPVLTIQPLGSSQFEVNITNGAPGAVYELWWIPDWDDPVPQWSMLPPPGEPGQTNFVIDGGEWPMAFFRASIARSYNGIWDYQLANPNDPSLGALAIVIDSPTNGAIFQ